MPPLLLLLLLSCRPSSATTSGLNHSCDSTSSIFIRLNGSLSSKRLMTERKERGDGREGNTHSRNTDSA